MDMNELTLNKQHSKLKDWCFKMPKISYCNRWVQVQEDNKRQGK